MKTCKPAVNGRKNFKVLNLLTNSRHSTVSVYFHKNGKKNGEVFIAHKVVSAFVSIQRLCSLNFLFIFKYIIYIIIHFLGETVLPPQKQQQQK